MKDFHARQARDAEKHRSYQRLASADFCSGRVIEDTVKKVSLRSSMYHATPCLGLAAKYFESFFGR